jgi:alkanesulfonate monooxygenase SsuD/methylene tetrahydromethanopterin reductase-like flavin-dependent oxidoreductase (luciferase family)
VPEAAHDGLFAAALALGHTTHLRVATSVRVAFPRSPMVVAHAAGGLAAVFDGRFELGLGSQVRGNLEGLGRPALGPALHALARAGRWAELPALLDDALLDALAPAAPYDEVAARLRERLAGHCTALAFPVPADPAHDDAARAAIEALRSRRTRLR